MFPALEFPFQILLRAIVLSVLWMGTSLLAWVVKIALIPIAVFSVKVWRSGWAVMWKRARENLTDAGIASGIIWMAIIIFNSIYTIPHGINTQARLVHVPLVKKFPNQPPDIAYIRTPRLSTTGRNLSEAQRNELVGALSKYSGQKFSIDCAVNDPEAHRFAGEIRDALIQAKWQMISYAPMWNMGFSSALNWQNYFGVQWFELEGSPQMPAAPALRKELKACCGITADGVMWPNADNSLEGDAVYVWIGPDNAKLIH